MTVAQKFLDRTGVCGALIATRDWARTSLGPMDSWPAALIATVLNMLRTRQPMLLFWGRDLIQFYNDAMVPSIGGDKHPAAIGQRAGDCWSDAWPVVGAQIRAVMRDGEPAWHEDALVPIFRNGRMEEVFWTYSYSPAFDDQGEVRGTLVIVTEVTGRVVATRRLEALASLNTGLSRATSADQVIATVAQLATQAPADIPFFLAIDPAGVALHGAGVAAEHARAVADQIREAAPVEGLAPCALTAGVPAGPWPEVVGRVVIDAARAAPAVLVFGLSPRLSFDDGYRSYLAQIVDLVGSALDRIVRTEERSRMLADLQAADRAKDEFLAMLGHELRNPLAPIVTALEMMRMQRPEIGREHGVIDRQVRHVIRLVDDLLDVSKIARGKLTLQREMVDLADVAQQAVESCSELTRQRRHHVVVDAPRGICVLGDEVRLVQVVSNLVTNAARYTPNGGHIAVTLLGDADSAVLRVADSGSGIAPELIPTLFDMFVQGAQSADRAEGGLGLGLAIVKNLVDLHGGSVSVTSGGAGKGSAFTIRLARSPRREGEAAQRSPKPAAVAPMRLLLVDDNEDAASLLADLARLRGHDVVVAHHPSLALSIASDLQPDVAVLDIGLPDMNGYELAARLREMCPTCRLIALSGYGQDQDRARSRDAGFSAHLVKPVSVNAFFDVLAAGEAASDLVHRREKLQDGTAAR